MWQGAARRPLTPCDLAREEAIRLAEEAAALEENMIKGVLGRGALGAVFEARMPCGRLVALKLAPPGSPEEDMLRNEAMVYLVLQELWNKDVPELLLAGPLRAFRSGYALGTCLSPGRPLQEGDADLLPAALAILANVHARGVIHGDLREENFLVNEAGIAMGGAKTIMLFDFSHSSIDSDKEAQADEVD
ncbi:g2173 [Coccomyxa elongata]